MEIHCVSLSPRIVPLSHSILPQLVTLSYIANCTFSAPHVNCTCILCALFTARSDLSNTVNECEIMDEDRSYHDSITSAEAEKTLRMCGEKHLQNNMYSETNTCYLTRYSESNACYILSVYRHSPTEIIKHFKLKINEGLAQVEGKRVKFSRIGLLLHHYQHHRIDPAFKNIGYCYTSFQYWGDLQAAEAKTKTRRRSKRCNVL